MGLACQAHVPGNEIGLAKFNGPSSPSQTDDSGNVRQYKRFMDNSTHALVILKSGSLLSMVLMTILSNQVD